MISVTIAWREYLFTTSYITLVTDMDTESVSCIQDWIKSTGRCRLNELEGLDSVLSLLGSLVEHISKNWEVKAIYTTDYGDFVSVHNMFKNDQGLETIYVDLDREGGARFQIGTFNHFGPRTSATGFLSLNPHLFDMRIKRKIQDKTDSDEVQIFEDVLDIMED